ncbi:MAG: hypothetical protein PUB46_00095 [Lachnospiraceae bacterium]|nr:hypothetical protein [Lachnospiraceae bacterium]
MVSDKVKELEQENYRLRVQLDELQELYKDRATLPKNCEYCENFLQHYIKCGFSYMATCDGHCIAGNRIKSRKAGDKSCKYFVPRKYGRIHT